MNRSILAFAMVATAFAAFAKEPRQIDNNGRGGRPPAAALEERGKHGKGGRDGAAFVSEKARVLAAACRENPTAETKAALLEQLRADYDAALARAKERVQNMENNREARISAAMKRLVSATPEHPGRGERKGAPERGKGGKRHDGPRAFRHPPEGGEPPAPPPPEADEPPAPAPDDGGEPPAPPPEGGFSMVP